MDDRRLLEIKEALRTAEAATSLDGGVIHAGVRATLERVMPVYGKHWWPAHNRTNRKSIAAAERLVARHGAALDAAMARAYDVTPDHPVWVDGAVYAHPLGAYTHREADARDRATDPGYGGYATARGALSRALKNQRVAEGVADAATKQGVEVPPQLWHAVLFYTAGALTARELEVARHPLHPLRGAGRVQSPLRNGLQREARRPLAAVLDGGPTRPEALAALVASFK